MNITTNISSTINLQGNICLQNWISSRFNNYCFTFFIQNTSIQSAVSFNIETKICLIQNPCTDSTYSFNSCGTDSTSNTNDCLDKSYLQLAIKDKLPRVTDISFASGLVCNYGDEKSLFTSIQSLPGGICIPSDSSITLAVCVYSTCPIPAELSVKIIELESNPTCESMVLSSPATE